MKISEIEKTIEFVKISDIEKLAVSLKTDVFVKKFDSEKPFDWVK